MATPYRFKSDYKHHFSRHRKVPFFNLRNFHIKKSNRMARHRFYANENITMLNNKMKDYGILKSLGFTTGQLIMQTALSFMPSVVIFTVVGLTISSLLINPLLSLFFKQNRHCKMYIHCADWVCFHCRNRTNTYFFRNCLLAFFKNKKNCAVHIIDKRITNQKRRRHNFRQLNSQQK